MHISFSAAHIIVHIILPAHIIVYITACHSQNREYKRETQNRNAVNIYT